MLNASALLGQSAGALAVRNPWSGAARLTRGAIAHQSNFYKSWWKNSPNNLEHFTSFKTYTFVTIQAENSTLGARRQAYRTVTTDLSSGSLSTAWTAINATLNGYPASTTEMLVLKSAGSDALMLQALDAYNGTNFSPASYYSTDGVTFTTLPYLTRRINEANSRLFLFDSATNGGAFTNIYSATSASVIASPGASGNWVLGTLPQSANWERVIYGNSRWLIYAPQQQRLAYSTDGQAWVEFTNFNTYFNAMFNTGIRNVYDFRFDGTNFWIIAIQGGRIQSFSSTTGEYWTPVSEFMVDDHQIMELSGNMVNGVWPRNAVQYAAQDFATPPVYYNGQWFYRVRAQVPGRTVTASGTGLWETEFLVSTPDFLVWNKHPDHWVSQHSRDVTSPSSAFGWTSDRVNQDYMQGYSAGGVYSLAGGAPLFKPGPGYAGQNLNQMLIADTTNAREVYYAL